MRLVGEAHLGGHFYERPLEMALMMFLVPLGLGGLVLRHPLAIETLNWGGAAFLLWLSWRTATSGRVESVPAPSPVGYVGAAVFQWVNPKSWLVTVSSAGTFLHVDAGSPALQSAALGGLFFLGALPSCFVWLAFGASVHRVLGSERRRGAFSIAMGALLALSVALVLR